MFAKGEYYDLVEMSTLACAPTYLADTLLLVEDLGDDNIVPSTFDYAPIRNVCRWFWRADVGEQRLYCYDEDPNIRPALADAIVGRVAQIKREGSEEIEHPGRLIFASSLDLEGMIFDTLVLGPASIGPIAFPNRDYGFGWHPATLRPDGTDPNNPNDTFARDFIATVTVKTATEIVGVPVSYRNANLCSADQWQGPDAKGRFYCKEPWFEDGEEPPDANLWAYDYTAFYYSVEPPDLEIRPLLTLGASGLMDQRIPGGHVSHLMGSEQLADPDWEGCRWPDTFEPDEMLTYGSVEREYTHTSQTYRFGKDPKQDVRVALATSWRRVFCPYRQ